ncbi:MAG TPA: CDP-alcohol phosphatidyltransferase family protein, partial [Chryseosolibacter sp.]
RYKVASVLGAKLDSIGDDLTVLAATVGLFVTRFAFIREQVTIFVVLFVLFLIQFGLSFYRHKKMSTFHTYLAKVAAVTTAIFLLSVFFFDRIYYGLFYAAVFLTGIGIIEEIILAVILKEYRSNVKGLYWVLKEAGQGRDGA